MEDSYVPILELATEFGEHNMALMRQTDIQRSHKYRRSLYICAQLISLKVVKTIQWEDSLFQNSVPGQWVCTDQRMSLDPSPYRKVNSNWAKDLNLS